MTPTRDEAAEPPDRTNGGSPMTNGASGVTKGTVSAVTAT